MSGSSRLSGSVPSSETVTETPSDGMVSISQGVLFDGQCVPAFVGTGIVRPCFFFVPEVPTMAFHMPHLACTVDVQPSVPKGGFQVALEEECPEVCSDSAGCSEVKGSEEECRCSDEPVEVWELGLVGEFGKEYSERAIFPAMLGGNDPPLSPSSLLEGPGAKVLAWKRGTWRTRDLPLVVIASEEVTAKSLYRFPLRDSDAIRRGDPCGGSY
ncbi:unnamed protein product [Cyprideis torosa]|uniref:Uncharacterized protein n=1 Tax=Cyprideis torosa TaxID=163714 RepID=A0A7R8W1N4_9CRUS|nr:unnamed protein product [Cyprideis torosa]CAG0881106.1 unnamed protein product [Cyprideis torosa]